MLTSSQISFNSFYSMIQNKHKCTFKDKDGAACSGKPILRLGKQASSTIQWEELLGRVFQMQVATSQRRGASRLRLLLERGMLVGIEHHTVLRRENVGRRESSSCRLRVLEVGCKARAEG